MKLAGAFPRNLEALQDVFTLAEAFYLMASVPSAGQFPVSFALEELFTNMVKYNPNGQGQIQIDLEYRDGEVRLDLAAGARPGTVNLVPGKCTVLTPTGLQSFTVAVGTLTAQ